MPKPRASKLKPGLSSRKEIRFPWWKWVLIWLVSVVLRAYMFLVRITTRVDASALEPWWVAQEEGRNAIGAVWHQDVIISAFVYRGRNIVSMVSTSKDGEMITYVARKLGYRIVRGSQAQRGRKALGEMIDYFRENSGAQAALTVDGSRGPVYVCKIGIVHLAQETGAPIVPVRTWAKRHFLLESWDRTMIPLPFNRIIVLVGDPVGVPADATSDDRERARLDVERQLKELSVKAERWFDGSAS